MARKPASMARKLSGPTRSSWTGFLLDAGAEILLETGRFWSICAQLEPDGHCHIRGVIGPEEYHEHIDDNAFTNVMARWNIRRALEAAALLRERWPTRWASLSSHLSLDEAELTQWARTAATIATGLDPRTGLFEQFAGCHQLEDVDFSRMPAAPCPWTWSSGGIMRRSPSDQAGGCRRPSGASARRNPRRDGDEEFPILRASLQPRQFVSQVMHGYVGSKAGNHRNGAALISSRRRRSTLAIPTWRSTAAYTSRLSAASGALRGIAQRRHSHRPTATGRLAQSDLQSSVARPPPHDQHRPGQADRRSHPRSRGVNGLLWAKNHTNSAVSQLS